MHYTSIVGSTVERIQTVRDFLDIFPKKLSGLPLNKEVEFEIEVLSGTTPVSIAFYRMAPKDLKELKLQF